LHWLKDVLLEEDKSKIKAGMAAQNFSIVRSKYLRRYLELDCLESNQKTRKN
jgi:predicted transposase YbfD/YdcC